MALYDSEPELRHFRRLMRRMGLDAAQAVDLALSLAKRDILAMYKQTFLGYFWAFFLPAVNTLTWLFLRSTGIITLTDTGMSYPVYVISGTILWQIFAEALQAPIQEVAASKELLTKINFPREALILSGIFKTLFNAGIKLVVMVPVLLLMGVMPDWQVLFFPLAVLSLILTGTAIGSFLSPVSLLYGDVSRAMAILLQLAMYITPVVYAIPSQGIVARVFQLNFVAPILMNARNWLTGLAGVQIGYTVAISLTAVMAMFFVLIVYRIAMSRILERIG